MLNQLQIILQELEKTEENLQKSIFKKNEIQKEMHEIDDFYEFQDAIQQHIILLQKTTNLSRTLKILFHLSTKLGRCIDNIELVRAKISILRNHISENKIDTSDA